MEHYISKPVLMGKLTSGDMQKKIKAMNGEEAYNEFLTMLNETPAVEVEPVRHGRWIHPKDYIVSNGFLCSECEYEEPSHRPINPRPGGSCIADNDGNFYYPPETERCPKCNAKMYGGADNG